MGDGGRLPQLRVQGGRAGAEFGKGLGVDVGVLADVQALQLKTEGLDLPD
jgi:hypothetical protein